MSNLPIQYQTRLVDVSVYCVRHALEAAKRGPSGPTVLSLEPYRACASRLYEVWNWKKERAQWALRVEAVDWRWTWRGGEVKSNPHHSRDPGGYCQQAAIPFLYLACSYMIVFVPHVGYMQTHPCTSTLANCSTHLIGAAAPKS
jgi:hypothetical protein